MGLVTGSVSRRPRATVDRRKIIKNRGRQRVPVRLPKTRSSSSPHSSVCNQRAMQMLQTRPSAGDRITFRGQGAPWRESRFFEQSFNDELVSVRKAGTDQGGGGGRMSNDRDEGGRGCGCGCDHDEEAAGWNPKIRVKFEVMESQKERKRKRKIEREEEVKAGNETALDVLLDPDDISTVARPGWQEIEVTADSGACETVMPAEMLEEVKTHPSPGSLKNKHYEVANGQAINKNRGRRDW